MRLPMMQQLIISALIFFISTLYASDLQSELIGDSKITSVSPVPHYYLTVKKLSSAGKFALQMSKTSQDNKEICSLIADFATSNYYKERNMGVPYNVGHTKGFDNQGTNTFLWDIPQLGLITVQQDGSVLFGHDPTTTQLTQDELSVRTPGKLFLNMLRVGKLNIKSPEAHICDAIVADRVHVDRTVYNHAALQTKQLMGNGEFINQGRVAFEGTQEEPAQLGIANFTNDKCDSHENKPQPHVTGDHVRLTPTNERVRNEKGAHFDIADLVAEKTTSDNGFLYNKGLLHARNLDMQRQCVNRGFVQSNDFKAQCIENKKSGCIKILDHMYVQNLINEGEMDVARLLNVDQGVNKGVITGSPDLALSVDHAMRNNGSMRLLNLQGKGTLNNNKKLLFHPDARINIKNLANGKSGKLVMQDNADIISAHVLNDGKLINQSGVVTCTDSQIDNNGVIELSELHLENQARLDNKENGFIETQKHTTINNATLNNSGTYLMQGDAGFNTALINNTGTIANRSGLFGCINTPLINKGNWLFENMQSAYPIDMTNDNLLELAQSSIHFAQLHNSKYICAYSGVYTVDAFKNNSKLQLMNNDWAITDDKTTKQAAQFTFLNQPKNALNNADLGDIEVEQKLLYDLEPMPKNLFAQGDIDCSSKRIRNVKQLQSITTRGKVVAACDPATITNGDLAFPNIGHLELFLKGLIKYGSLKAPALTLHIAGLLKLGQSNAQLGTIAATHGPLTVDADSIDGRYGKFYGKGRTLLEATKGNITIGALARGVDENIKQQFKNGCLSHYPVQGFDGLLRKVAENFLSAFDYTLDVKNGAYAACDDFLTLRAKTYACISHGAMQSALGTHLYAPDQVINWSGKISSRGPITIESHAYNHLRGESRNRPCANQGVIEFPYSIAATLETLDKVNFITKKVHNRAGFIRAGGGITLNGSRALTPATGYTTQEQVFRSMWVNSHSGSKQQIWLTQCCATQSGGAITFSLGNFVITGTMNSPFIMIQAKNGTFLNSKLTRETKNITRPIVVDVTRFMQQQAQQPGFYQLGAHGAVQTEFPFGVPSAPQLGEQVLLENPNFKAPLRWKTIFNPLSSVNLDLHLQQLLASVAGKIYAGNAKGNQLANVLWNNAHVWRQQHGKEVMSQAELNNVHNSMLLSQIMHNGAMEQQQTLLCVAPGDVCPYQDQGDIAAGEFICVTEGDQIHRNNRIVADGPGGITVRSTDGNVLLETETYTTVYRGGEQTVIEQHAFPQQQLIATRGSVSVTAHNNLTRLATGLAAADQVSERAEVGSVIKQPLILQKLIETRKKKEGWFSSKTTVSTDISHRIEPSVTIAGTVLHDVAGSSIHAVAPQDVAGQEIIYQSPNTVIEGVIVADKASIKTEKSGLFSDESHSEQKETPCALPAIIRAPTVRFAGSSARINASIGAHELHDDTIHGAQFVAKVKEMLYCQQTLLDSPFMSVDAGCKGGYEVMIPPMLMVDRIIRNSNVGKMLFESAVIDKNRTEIIGRFVEATYALKKWEERWCHKSQLICDEGLVLIGLVIAIATDGMGVELLAGMLETVTAATGMQLTAAGIAMVNAGVSAVCATTATSFLRTGDPLQTVEHLASDQFLKSLSFDMISAGLCSQLGTMFDIKMHSGTKSFVDHVQEQALRSTVDALLNIAINDVSVDQALANAGKQIALKAVAGYVSTQICSAHIDATTRKAAHIVLGGLSGFAGDHSIKGFVSSALGALTAQTVGDMLLSDAQEIAANAIDRVDAQGKPLTPEHIQKEIKKEINGRVKIAKIAAATVATLTQQNPSMAVAAAGNALDNDSAVRAELYAHVAYQNMLSAASQAIAALNMHNAQNMHDKTNVVQRQKAPAKQEKVVTPRAESSLHHELVLHNARGRIDAYDNEVMACAGQWEPEVPRTRPSLYERIVNPTQNPVVKASSKIIQPAVKAAVNDTVNLLSYAPNPVGLACFAASSGRDIYQKKTTPGELLFDMALAYGVLKGIKATGKVLYQKVGAIKNITDGALNRLHQARYKLQGRVPFVDNPRDGYWIHAAVSDDVVLTNGAAIEYEKMQLKWRKDKAAPFNVLGHGHPRFIEVDIQGIHPRALSQKNLAILREEGKVRLNEVQLARLIRTAPGYEGQHINLLSCSCGAKDNGIAQKLATRMDVPVSAFTTSVVLFKERFFTFPSETGKCGVLKTFYPESLLSRLSPAVLLPALLLAGSDRFNYSLRLSEVVIDHNEQRPFVENPERGIWRKACISGDLMLQTGTDEMFQRMMQESWEKDDRCPFNVTAHGSSTSVEVQNKNIHAHGLNSFDMRMLLMRGSVILHVGGLARLIRTAHGYKEGQHINLYSCECGSDPEGLAQQLADEMEVPVSAFTGTAVSRCVPYTRIFYFTSDGWLPTSEKIKTFYPRPQKQRQITNLEGAFGFALD